MIATSGFLKKIVPKFNKSTGSILTVGTSLSALIIRLYISYPIPSKSTTMTISYFLGINEIKMTSITIVYLGDKISLAGLISNSFWLSFPSPGIRRLNLKGTLLVLVKRKLYLLGKLYETFPKSSNSVSN